MHFNNTGQHITFKYINTPSHVSNMSLMMKSINPICDLGIEHVARSNSGITIGRLFAFSSSVCGKGENFNHECIQVSWVAQFEPKFVISLLTDTTYQNISSL
jgi:hypothetical protein